MKTTQYVKTGTGREQPSRNEKQLNLRRKTAQGIMNSRKNKGNSDDDDDYA